jgi:SPFH domain / Band 7 family
MIIKLFSSAGATGHVFFFKNGRPINKGLAHGGLIGPMTTVAVVPTTAQIIQFVINALTKDNQRVTVAGNLTVKLDPVIAVLNFDFTVDPRNGGYQGNWQETLNALTLQHVVRAVLASIKEMDIEQAIRSQNIVEEAVTTAFVGDTFKKIGVTVESCLIPKVEPSNDDVLKSIGARERELRLTEADNALHQRRTNAATNDRAVKRYEAETVLTLETERAKLITEQANNEELKATGDAKALKIRLAPLQALDAGRILGAALMTGFQSGRVGNVALTTELFSALKEGGVVENG